jgi:hypothetical protein
MIQPALFQPPTTDRLEALRARAIKTRHRHQKRRAKSEAVLADALPTVPEAGYSYHVISHGDVDSLSYLNHLVKAWPLDYVLISTWCMAMADVDCLITWLNTGRIGELDFVLGEIFPTQYPDETDKLHRLEAAGEPVKLRIARNHAKVMLASNPDEAFYCVIESSANVNTNPRIEQTCLTRDRDLFEFYQDFFNGIHSVTKNPYA